ncbi:DMP19 family protein [Sinomicrobium sp. M5D2P9]
MRNGEITDKYYKEVVTGLNETILNDKDLWYSYVINLPLHLQIVYTIVVFHQQVFNGGLHQYFFNSYGQFAYLTVEQLKLIKAFKTSSILERAIREVNIENFSIDEFRAKIFNREIDRIVDFDEKLSEFLELLDNEYDDLDEDLEQLLVDYLESR